MPGRVHVCGEIKWNEKKYGIFYHYQVINMALAITVIAELSRGVPWKFGYLCIQEIWLWKKGWSICPPVLVSGCETSHWHVLLDIHVMVNWQLSKKGICWSVLHNFVTGWGVQLMFLSFPLNSYWFLIDRRLRPIFSGGIQFRKYHCILSPNPRVGAFVQRNAGTVHLYYPHCAFFCLKTKLVP